MRRSFGILALAVAGGFMMQAQSIITTVAGNGSTGSTGDGGLATGAQIGNPGGVAVDSTGNIYIADALNNRIRKVDASGNITTYVGTAGNAGFSGDGGPAASASINLVSTAVHSGIAVDKQGNLYIADTGNNCIRKVTASGLISTIAGMGGTAAGLSGDGGAATSAKLAAPLGVAVDGNGNVYIADTGNGRVRKVDTSGTITTVAGTTTGSNLGDGGLATSAQLFNPDDVAVDAAGNVFIADYNNGRVRRVDAAGIITSLNVGAASPSVASLAVDNGGNIFMATGSSVLKYIAPGAVSVYAGGGLSIPGDGGSPTSATLGAPLGVALDAAGNLFISDKTSSRVRKVTPGATCNFTLSTTSLSPVFSGGSFPITVQTSSGCTWGVPTLPSWITLSGAASGTGNGTVTLVVGATQAGRTATFTIGGVVVTVTQGAPPTCSYAISSTGQVFPAAGGTVTVNVTAPAGCAWDVVGSPDGIQVVGATTGSGSGTVVIFATPQPSGGGARGGFFTIANLKYAVQQQAFTINGLSLVGSMPHLPGEMGWSTILTFVNKGPTAVTARTNLLAADGTAMTLPVGLPQQSSLPGPLLASSLDQILSPSASWVMDAAGTTSATLEGSAQLLANVPNSLDGFAIFHFDPNNQEAVVPLETRSASSYYLAFDNTSGVQTGMAVANQSAKGANISVTIFDDSGNQLGAMDTIQLAGNGHTSFVLGAQAGEKYPATAGLRGMIEFDAPVGGRISALGIRYTGGTTTTIPALANVVAGNGIMAHLASGAGWQTTFVFVNVGQGTGVASLSFHGDNGQPLSLPLTFPQGGASDALVTGYNTPTLVPGASWYVQSGGDLTTALLTGSAQVTTSANIGAFVIFRYNPNGQEAVVPLENRNASTYMIAFDNTAGTATGVAVANASSTNISLPYIVRDDSGLPIDKGTGTLPLAANGHTSFGLSDFAPVSAGRRGVIEFDAPTGASISVLGIRSPPALTFTTLPAIAK
jgi:sugar lactone lactonase YvrE